MTEDVGTGSRDSFVSAFSFDVEDICWVEAIVKADFNNYVRNEMSELGLRAFPGVLKQYKWANILGVRRLLKFYRHEKPA